MLFLNINLDDICAAVIAVMHMEVCFCHRIKHEKGYFVFIT